MSVGYKDLSAYPPVTTLPDQQEYASNPFIRSVIDIINTNSEFSIINIYVNNILVDYSIIKQSQM